MDSIHTSRFSSLFSPLFWYKPLVLGVLMVVSVAGYGQLWQWAYPVENLQIADYAQDAEGNMAVFGQFFNNSVRLGDTVLYSSVQTYNQRGYFVAKLSIDGKVIWHDFIGWPDFYPGIGTCLAYGVALDQEGNVLICGDLPISLIWGSGQATNQFGFKSAFIMKYHSNGGVDWFKELNKRGDFNFAIRDLQIDEAGNIYLGLLHAARFIIDEDTLSGTFSFVKLNPAGEYDDLVPKN